MSYDFYCPRCKVPVFLNSNGYLCQTCQNLYSLDKGYVDFLGDVEFYAGEVTQEDMQNLIKDIDLEGYELGLSKLFRSYPNLYGYITDVRRADWLCHCLGKNNLRCLDIGSGLGNLSEALSYIYPEVYSLEAVVERLEFQKRRYKNSGRSNVKIVRANALELPFPDEHFDLVVCNGVLEWIGSMNRTLSPRDGQLEFLREVRRVLSPIGCLYVGIENRYSISYLMGARDHSGIPYTSILPRSIASLLVKALGPSGGTYGDKTKREKEERGYYTYTYSIFGYRSLFKEAGYKVNSFWAFPTYNRPNFSGRVDDSIGIKGLILHLKEKGSKARSILSFAAKLDKSFLGGLASIITPSFLFYCYKNSIPETYEEAMLGEIGVRNYTLVSQRDKLLYLLYNKNANPSSIIHLRRYKYNFRETIPVHDIDSGRGSKTQTIDPIWIEKWVPGRILNPLNYEESYLAVKWLIDFQNKTRVEDMGKNDLFEDVKEVREGLSKLDCFKIPEYQTWLEEYESYGSRLVDYRSAEHGDYWHGNIFYDLKLNKIKVVDWEYSRENGDPFYDFSSYIIGSMLEPNRLPKDFQSNLSGSGPFSSTLTKLEEMMRNHFGFKLNLYPLMAYAMLRFVVRKAGERNSEDKKNINYYETIDRYRELLKILNSNYKQRD